MSEFRKALDKYSKYVIQQSRTNLTKGNNNASKQLYNSLSYKIQNGKVSFESEDYGQFIDKGVKGAESYYADAATSSSPFRYKSKMPPPKAFDKWTIRKGIAARDKKGKFLKRQSLNFLIARSIYKKGIRATLFFTKPFEAGIIKYSDEMIQGFLQDNLDLK